ncbi:acetyl-CoA carboxylase biotin carboxyl carrier protein [Acetobacter sp.]|jgi:acetyl-CoA carboxylase biotin carboxyl carrier protein|uniref:acetyl-CoA carboxylase biotin carboxyl carrier protein n=1 Tax=Acetobacter sp. TaxID=440 RepID=UPI0025BD1956|nr:biotin/lipoyl-containing protein [Acetobacter sp.]MCH4089911.1 acetyl-CoA carboxylase biotin carboxyl carrier protein subunit [Acetobacter sp.]MCI1298607.1 acetyl-CoA carboxylase biotin carboxyl carrier protein subunit [Acetobacter sp.]MCI1315172.1 acetyl-CoA carboxylase biotin carboxyl carrier protein subunit [Acetobacter sp.]
MKKIPSFSGTMDMEQLCALMSCMQQLGVRLLDYTTPDGKRIVLRGPETAQTEQPAQSRGAAILAPPAPAPLAASQLEASMHGVFYAAPSPGEESYVQPGDVVEEGQTIGILEAMKTLTLLEADYRCRILSVLVKNATMVEPGTPLFSVEKLDD